MNERKILVVEDEGIVALDIKGRLESIGYKVVATVDNGQEAIDIIKTDPPDLALMDIQIKGDLDGIETAEKIASFIDLPVIFLTANADEATLQRAKCSGPLAYLLKPFDERELRTTIEIGLYRHQLEKTIRSHEERWSKTLLSIGDAVIATDNEGKIVFMNPVAEEIVGWRQDDALEQPIENVLALFSETSGQPVNNPVLEVIKKNHTVLLENHTELHRKDGKILTIEDSAAPIHDKSGKITGVVLVFRDISEKRKQEQQLEQYRNNLEDLVETRTRDLLEQKEMLEQEIELHAESEKREKKLQAELNRAERMKSLALLAGGVAHDLNNMLGPLVAYPELILRKISEDSPIRKQILSMQNSAMSAADVVQDLLTLARRGRYEMEVIDINSVIKEYLESASFQMTLDNYPKIKLIANLSEGKLNILGSAPHLMKLIMNLCLNALEAMVDGGKLDISTGIGPNVNIVELTKENISGDYILLRIKDTGTGIPEENLKSIFEPYFSEKQMGKSGSGLGLAVVYGVLKDHKGFYDVNSEVGKGTEFNLYFPICEDKSNKKVNNLVRKKVSDGHILVVDDLEEQLEMAGELLETLGFKVDKVNSGRKAVEFLKRRDVDLVLLDMIMEPDFDGLDTLRAIKKFKPYQKVIVVSGYSESERVLKMKELGATQYIRKPYTIENISNAISFELAKPVIPAP